MTPTGLAALLFVAERPVDRASGRRQTVDLRRISEPMRQAIIDLGMREPPFVEVDADQVTITADGELYLEGAGKT